MVQLATKTLAAINKALEADQGNAYRMWLGKVLPHISDAYRQDDEPFRSHMGASSIGVDCARRIWYGFRWATPKFVEGRMLRLFNRGHLEEGRFIALLLMIGCTVHQQDENGKQFKISDAGGHFGGSGDGVVQGVPDLAPGTYALSEFKTHNDKSFKLLEKDGLRSAKFEHYVQMQTYMRKMGLAVGIYVAVNKNDDHIYAEIVSLDSMTADRFIQRGVQIVPMHTPPAKIPHAAPGWKDCRFCDHRPVCLMGAPPARNCRTCEFSEPDTETGKWMCTNPERRIQLLFPASNPLNEDFSLTKERQFQGCEHYKKSAAAFG